MKSPWSHLHDTLEKQRKGYDHLYKLLKKKEKELISGNTRKLQVILRDEEKYINELDRLENERMKATAACTSEANVKTTLKEMLSLAPEAERQRLESAAMGLMETLNAVAALNRTNAELIKESMNFVGYNINLFSSDRRLDNMYGESGRVLGAEPRIRGIVNREA
ncbi:MAG TPA: flagellar protein FlgN [bacterium]|nr:flagellar protein FlgN [bacterium]